MAMSPIQAPRISASGGGGVVLATFGYSTSIGFTAPIFAPGLSPFQQVGGGNASAGAIDVAGAAGAPQACVDMMNGVTAPVSSTYANEVSLSAGASWCAGYTNGRDLLAINAAGNVVGLNTFPASASNNGQASYRNLVSNAVFQTCDTAVFEKVLTSGPDRDGDEAIDVVVPVGELDPTAYDFTITYIDPDNPSVWIYDRVPAEWDVTHIEGDDADGDLPLDCGGATSLGGDYGMVDVSLGGKPGKNCNSDTGFRWMPDADGGAEVLYGADGASGNSADLLILDPATGGVITNIGPIGYSVTGLAVHPTTGVMYGTTTSNSAADPLSLISIDTTSGAGTLIGVGGSHPGNMADITFDSTGTLYAWGEDGGGGLAGDDLYTIDLTTGVATKVADAGVATAGSGLAARADDTLFFAGLFDFFGTNPDLATVDQGTGAVTKIADLSRAYRTGALAFDDAGTLFGVQKDPAGNSVRALVTIDTATAAVTVIGLTVDRLDAIVFSAAANNDLNVQTLARCHDNKNNQKCRPTSCGALYLNYGAVAYEKDPDTGELVLDDDGNPIMVGEPTDGICLAAVEDVNGDGMFTWDGSGDEDADGLSDLDEACSVGTDPCLDDTDGDGVLDGDDECPLEGPADPSLGEILEDNGCIRQSECSDDIDNDDDGNIDYPQDASCESILDDSEDTHDGNSNPDCANNPLWRPVECTTPDWVWSSDKANATDVPTADSLMELYTGDQHFGEPCAESTLGSLDGTGYVSTQQFVMQGCNTDWYHLGGWFTGDCGNHDGDIVRRLTMNVNACYDYTALPNLPPFPGAPVAPVSEGGTPSGRN
jgi:hypothetical protein